MQQATWRYRARVKVHAPAGTLAARLPRAVTLRPVDDRTCIATVGSDTPATLATYLCLLGADFEVLDAPELRRELRALGRRLLRAGTRRQEKPKTRARAGAGVRRGAKSRR